MQERQEAQVQSLGREDPLEQETATHSSILAWDIPWMVGPPGNSLSSSWLQQFPYLETHTHTHTHTHDFYFLSLINNSHISSKATRKYLYFASNFFSLVLSLKQSNQTFALITLPKLLLSGLLIIFILLNIITDFQLFSAWPVSSTWHTWSLLPPWYTFFT